jgi:hypothetical protein
MLADLYWLTFVDKSALDVSCRRISFCRDINDFIRVADILVALCLSRCKDRCYFWEKVRLIFPSSSSIYSSRFARLSPLAGRIITLSYIFCFSCSFVKMFMLGLIKLLTVRLYTGVIGFDC